LGMTRIGFKKAVSWTAIYAVALHVMLIALIPIAANGEIVNPYSVICHSAPINAAGDETPAKPDLIPGHACEHCNLCSAAPPPEPAIIPIGSLLPARLLQVLRPVSQAPHAGVAVRPNFARGPPRTA